MIDTAEDTAKQLRMDFLEEIISGLTSRQKSLPAKYCFDDAGSILFAGLGQSEEYYQYKSEKEIFQKNARLIAREVTVGSTDFELIELGPGDGSITLHLLQQLVDDQTPFTYHPIDISAHVISLLQKRLSLEIPGLRINGLNGEYFTVLEKIISVSKRRKVILCKGSNLGNMSQREAMEFCRRMRALVRIGDQVIIGMALKKDPAISLATHNDKAGLTKALNLNILKRMNRELQTDFRIASFSYFPTYDPSIAACKSYLISLRDQNVLLQGREIVFRKYEEIYMGIAQTYQPHEIEELAEISGFKSVKKLSDRRKWFSNVIWTAV